MIDIKKIANKIIGCDWYNVKLSPEEIKWRSGSQCRRSANRKHPPGCRNKECNIKDFVKERLLIILLLLAIPYIIIYLIDLYNYKKVSNVLNNNMNL